MWKKQKNANRRGIGDKAVVQEALEKACLPNIRHAEQDHLGINVCLTLLYVTHWWCMVRAFVVKM